MSNHLPSIFFNLLNGDEFIKGIQHSINHIDPVARDGIYAGDNLFTYGRNLSFLNDQKLMTAFNKQPLLQSRKRSSGEYR